MQFCSCIAEIETKITTASRVAKCQGYWGYIRVKMFAGWGKKFGRTCNFAPVSQRLRPKSQPRPELQNVRDIGDISV